MKKTLVVITLAAALAGVSPAAAATVPAGQTPLIWEQVCTAVAQGQVFANPGPLDCENPRTEFPNFSSTSLNVLQRVCEEAFGGEFLVRSQDTEHAYCFLP